MSRAKPTKASSRRIASAKTHEVSGKRVVVISHSHPELTRVAQRSPLATTF
jgi:hypothetical protein